MSSFDRVLAKSDLRKEKLSRVQFVGLERRPIRVILDGVSGNYNIGALFRLCDAMLLEQLIICSPEVNIRNRRIVQAAQGTQHWVPWQHQTSAVQSVIDAKNDGYQICVIELTANSRSPDQFQPKFPLCLVIGAERDGVSQEIIEQADISLAILMHGMANSLNLATAAAIVFYEICKHVQT